MVPIPQNLIKSRVCVQLGAPNQGLEEYAVERILSTQNEQQHASCPRIPAEHQRKFSASGEIAEDLDQIRR